MPIENFIFEEVLKVKLRQRRGPRSNLFDSEIITMEIVGEFLDYHEDKGIWQYFDTHWKSWFSMLGAV